MGKKAKKSTKQAWKKSEAAKEYEDTLQTVKEDERIANEASDKLFFIDTTGFCQIREDYVIGSDRLRKKIFEDEVGESMPKEERRKVDLLKKQLEKVDSLCISDPQKKNLNQKKKHSKVAAYDLWEAEAPSMSFYIGF